MNPVHFSSATPEWATPQAFFDKLNEEFGFTLDVCATHENAKCEQFLSVEDDGLSYPWGESRRGPVVAWMNCPYGKTIGAWVRKAHEEQLKGVTVVALLPARTDTAWWHDYVQPYAELRFVRGRLKFGGHKNSAPFPSVIAIYRGVK